MSKIGKAYRSPLGFGGLCFNIPPNSALATLMLNMLEPIIKKCHHCGDPAVRVGMFELIPINRSKDAMEIRGLCERHKQFGMW